MAETDDQAERLDRALGDLETSMVNAEGVSNAFRTEIEDVQSALKIASGDASTLSRSLGRNLKSAMDDLIFDGAKLSDVLGRVGRNMASTALGQALEPVQDAVSGALTTGVQSIVSGLFGFSKGGAFVSGRVTPFAKGGVVDGPMTFPMRGGTGLMGEAGPEAIMPLSRGADGRLGVKASGGNSVHVTMNITSPDAESFKRSSSQVAAQMRRMIARGNRNM